MSTKNERKPETRDGTLNRKILLGGTGLASAAAAFGTSAPARMAHAGPTTPIGRKPNILFIMSDDIGWFNISAYDPLPRRRHT